MYVAVAYDVQDNRRRARMSRTLDGFGERVQYSVYECDLEARHVERLVKRLQELVEPGDGVRVYRLPGGGEAEVLVLGGRGKVESPRIIIA